MNGTQVEYFQLKHSTTQVNAPFTLSDLKNTITGFAGRFKKFLTGSPFCSITYTIITNRTISQNFKNNIEKLASGVQADKTFTKTIKKYTNLADSELQNFCQSLRLCDLEGNYDAQKYDIHRELAKLSVSKTYSDKEKQLVDAIWSKIEPDKSNRIKLNDILDVFHITDIRDFFPASPQFETLTNQYIEREWQAKVVEQIESTVGHIVLTASGGVGKSIFTCQLNQIFKEPHIVVAYDCFGAGDYRKPSIRRHAFKNMVPQIINTFAKEGLCGAVIPERTEPDEHWIKVFLSRINEICQNLSSDALLIIVFDAADNAEMAANDLGESCFANQLLKESIPNNCRFVFTCRPERLSLLDLPTSITPITLTPFSRVETKQVLQQKYINATDFQVSEFHRLTSGNPRVQSNALALQKDSLNELLDIFGGNITSVESLIQQQLNESINRIKDNFPSTEHGSIENICTGLAILPPYVPLDVLANVAKTSIDMVRSFVTDLGRPLWLIDDTVQFRDEPTETWFQSSFSATPEQVSTFVNELKAVAENSSYITEALPMLLFKANRFDELVALALSKDYLPNKSTFDDTQAHIHRLQYAFQGALKLQKTYETVKLALAAGEVISGHDRQIELITNNTDLVSRYLSTERIQELAHRKEIKGGWFGSNTVYSASLLSHDERTQGEALKYLRSSKHWLARYFKEREKAKNNEEVQFNDQSLKDVDILEMATAHYNILGWENGTNFLLSWKPASCVFSVTTLFVRRLVDIGEFEQINLMAKHGKSNPTFILALTAELMVVGKTPPKSCLTACLNKMINPKSRIDMPNSTHDYLDKKGYSQSTFLAFFEACLIQNLPPKNIRRGLNHYFTLPDSWKVADNHSDSRVIDTLLRYLSMQIMFNANYDAENKLRKYWENLDKDKMSRRDSEIRKALNRVEMLLPLYNIRINAISQGTIPEELFDKAKELFPRNISDGYYDYNPIAKISTIAKFQILLFADCSSELKELFKENYSQKNLKSYLPEDLLMLRACCRNTHMNELIEVCQHHSESALSEWSPEDEPETRAENYLLLARAILPISNDEAGAYFDSAFSNAANFGQEATIRWEAITAIAKRYGKSQPNSPEFAHRYIRCAEMIGNSVTREKYWDRDDAIETCFQLSPNTAFAIANRWKDRHVGEYDRQIYALSMSAVKSGNLLGKVAWSVSAFGWQFGIEEFLAECFCTVSDKQSKQLMLNQLIRDLRQKGRKGSIWKTIKKIAEEHFLQHDELQYIDLLSATKDQSYSSTGASISPTEELDNKQKAWQADYGEFDLMTHSGLGDALQILDTRRKENKGVYHLPESFWEGALQKVTSHNVVSFLEVVIMSKQVSFYEIRDVFGYIPSAWKKKHAIRSQWNNLVQKIATRFPSDFVGIYENEYRIENFRLNDDSLKAIQTGVIKGMSDAVDIESASALFGFAFFSASMLTTDEAMLLTDFGLSRLEDYFDDDFADGIWLPENRIPEDLVQALTYYIYANLGSPFISERWRAIHSVRRLIDLKCEAQIDFLLSCLDNELPSIYIPKDYAFYDKHAKLYLLAGLNTITPRNIAPIISKHHRLLSGLALDTKQGILVQYYAKQLCQKLQGVYPNTFDEITWEYIQKVGQTQLGKKAQDRERVDTPWHKASQLSALPKIWFSYDIRDYWFRPLARVFGISTSQLEDVAKDILFNEWEFKAEEGRIKLNDSRQALWGELRQEQWELLPRHGSYPDVDTYDFYISYHLLLATASKLLENMPVVQNSYDEMCSWLEWLGNKLIYRENTRLLAELRDSVPLIRRSWIDENDSKEWQWTIVADDFINQLIVEESQEIWLNVAGYSQEANGDRYEKISFSSVLVPAHLSQSLLHTTLNYEDYLHECRLHGFCYSEYNDNTIEPFSAIQWLRQDENYPLIDEKDPFSGKITAQPYFLDDGLHKDILIDYSEDKKWWVSNNKVCLKNRYWLAKPARNYPDSEEACEASYASASLDFLMHICHDLNVDIAIQVNIKRQYTGRYREKAYDGYLPPYSKTFILSADGRIRDARKCYQLR